MSTENENENNQTLNPSNLYGMSKSQIDFEQQMRDKDALEQIKQAYCDGVIDKSSTDMLTKYYKNSMKAYDKMFKALHSVFGDPIDIKGVNTETGELTTAYMEHVTPNTKMIFEYVDGKNPVYLTLPGMKDVERAIAKVKKGSQYYKDAQAGKYEKTCDGLKDILRCTVSVKYYSSIKKIMYSFKNSSKIILDDKDIKDKFFDNSLLDSDKLQQQNLEKDKCYNKFSEKNYRDTKIYISLEDDLKVECQLKIQPLEAADQYTHGLYEVVRVLKDKLDTITDSKEHEQARLQINDIQFSIQYINSYGVEKYNQNVPENRKIRVNNSLDNGIENYNLIVLDKVKRMEDINRRNGYHPNKDGRYDDCAQFIEDNFLVRPFQVLNRSNPLPTASDTLKEVFGRYYFDIEKKYRSVINGNECNIYNEKYLEAEEDLWNAELKDFRAYEASKSDSKSILYAFKEKKKSR